MLLCIFRVFFAVLDYVDQWQTLSHLREVDCSGFREVVRDLSVLDLRRSELLLPFELELGTDGHRSGAHFHLRVIDVVGPDIRLGLGLLAGFSGLGQEAEGLRGLTFWVRRLYCAAR